MSLESIARHIAIARDHMLVAQIAAQQGDWAGLVDALADTERELTAALEESRGKAAA